MGQLGFRQRGIPVPVHDAHGIRIEHDLVDFGIAVLESLVEIGFLVELFGDVAQQEQGMVVRSGDGPDGGVDPPVGFSGVLPFAVFELWGLAQVEPGRDVRHVVKGADAFEAFWVHAVFATIEDEFLDGHQGRRNGDLFAVVIEGGDKPGLKIEGGKFPYSCFAGQRK